MNPFLQHCEPIKTEDAQELFDLTDLNRSYLREWLPWVDSVTSLEHTVAFIKDCILTEEMGKTATYTIWYQGKLAGVCGFNTIDHDKKEAYIGYWLGEEFQGNGLMTMACSELERIAFESLALDSVIIRAAVKNLKSRAIPERLGYQDVGRVKDAEWLYDHYVDFAVYQKYRKE